MKITKQRLKQIIKEEVEVKLQEIEDKDIASKQADMDEKAKQADMDEKAEQAAEAVMNKIEKLFEIQINEAAKQKIRRKKQTPTKTKTKEIEVPTDEEAFTVLQRIVKSINKKALEYETDPEQVAELIDYKTQVYKSMAKKMGVIMLIASILGGFKTLIQSGLDQEQVARAMQRQEIATQNIEYSGSREGKIAEFENYVNNTSAFRWGRGDQTMMPVPDSYKKTNGMPSQIDVLPPSYSIAIIALKHKMYGLEFNEAEGYFPHTDQIVNITDGNGEQAKNSLDDFFNKFPINSDGVGADYVDYSYIFDEEEGLGMTGVINQVPSSGFSRRTVMIHPDTLLQKPDYVLPENGLTVQEYYNMLYYGDYLSDAEAIELGIDK